MTLEEQIKQIIEEQLHVKIHGDYERLTELGADSLDLLELSMNLEEKFEIKIDDDIINTDFTVRDVIEIVKKECC